MGKRERQARRERRRLADERAAAAEGSPRCAARDGRGQQCVHTMATHPTVVNKSGERVLSHHTAYSWWCTENPRGPMVPDMEAPDQLWTPRSGDAHTPN